MQRSGHEGQPIPAEVDRVATGIVDCALRVHRELGPGLLENVYEACLESELWERRLDVKRQLLLPVVYKGRRLEAAYRVDLLVDGSVIVEIKSVDQVLPVHCSQILSYLRLSHCRVGLLINFKVPLLRDGIRRFAL